MQQVAATDVQRGDFIFHAGRIWKCTSRSLSQFQDIEDKTIQAITAPTFQKLETLQLVPRKWAVKDEVVLFEGQELGLGATHNLQLTSMREFEELNIVNREAAKNRKVDYTVTVARLNGPSWYVLEIELK